METRRHYILNYAFLSGLVVLALNDHILKTLFGNWLTGKLSDFAGMVILPLLLAYIFPKLRIYAIWLAALLFAFWKSPLSTPFIAFYNSFSLIGIERVVDYSDLISFAILPIPYFIIKDKSVAQSVMIRNFRLSPLYVVVPCIFLLMATSPPPSYYYTQSNGNLDFRKTSIKVRYTPEQILDKLRENGLDPVRDRVADHKLTSTSWLADKEKIMYYKVAQVIIDKDTLTDLEFSFKPDGDKTRVYLNSVNIQKDLSDEKVEKKLRKYYSKAAKRYFKQTFKN